MIQKIEALTNPKIKQLVRLQDSSRERKNEGKFVLEGLRLCLDCIDNSPIEAESVFFTEKLRMKCESDIDRVSKLLPSFEITEAIAKKLARTESSQGVFLLCKMGSGFVEIDKSGKYLALENVQNPDNFGSICRIAEAMGLSGIIVSSGVDPFNPKALRAAMGSSLRLNIIKADNLIETLERLLSAGMRIYSSVPDRSAAPIGEADLSSGCVVVLGNEANGVSDEVKKISSLLTIPMRGKAESLNVSAAASIIAWELSR